MKISLRFFLGGLFAVVFAMVAFADPAIAPPPPPPVGGALVLQPIHDKAAIIALTGPVDHVMFTSIERRVDIARKAGCTLIIYQIDGSGGLISSGLEIAAFTRKLQAEHMHVVAWVNSRAVSAGALVAVSCEQMVMSSAGVVGDCTPIEVNAEDVAAAPVMADLDASAKQNGYDQQLLRAMVIPSIEIHEMRNNVTGEEKFVDPKEKDKLLAEEVVDPTGAKEHPWKFVAVTDSADQVLTVNADLALKMGLSKATIDNEQALRSALNVRDELMPLDYNWLELTARWLSQPWVRGLLFVGMLMCAWMEFSHPGITVPGVIGVICLLLFVGAPYLTGLAQVWEVVAIVLGLGIIVADLVAFGGIGLLAIPGFCLLAIGLVASFVPIEPGGGWYPSMGETWSGLRTGLAVLVFGSLLSVFGFAMLSKYLYMTPGFRKLQLAPATGLAKDTGSAVRDVADRPATDAVFLGAIGIASTDLRPAGKVRFDQHLVDVVSFGNFIPRNSEVEVIDIAGTKVVVKTRDIPPPPANV